MMDILQKIVLILFVSVICMPNIVFAQKVENVRPKDFVDLHKVAPSIILDMRYFTPHNFVGERLHGYEAPKCLLTRSAAEALAKVEEEIKAFSLSLKVYDCYRPQRAVDRFVEWAKDVNDTKMKAEFYPDVDKKNLFKDGYIAEKSGHSRGSTVDLAIVSLPVRTEGEYVPAGKLTDCRLPAAERFRDSSLDFGTGYDCFDPLAHLASSDVGVLQRINRLLLKSIMEKYGFESYAEEWWHYKLKGEPYPDTYFNFVIK